MDGLDGDGDAGLALPEHLSAFPRDFLFGTATAAYQIEGAVAEGGRGPSIWDTFVKEPGRIHRGETAEVTCDHYHRWESDLDLMRALGYPAYRLSLSWARLQPAGRGPLNPEGVAYYRRLIQGCRNRGITPFVTLYHWDLPQALQDEGGWPQRDTAHRFGDYAAACFEALGDLLEHVITINEPWCLSFLAHEWGVQAPGWFDPASAIRALHHSLLAHGFALEAARTLVPDARIGISNILSAVASASGSDDDMVAARLLDIRMNRVVLEPCYRGEYSDEVRAVFEPLGLDDRLVQPGDLDRIAAPADFVGVNHYHHMLAAADPSAWAGIAITSAPPTLGTFGWSNTPDALHGILRRIHDQYSQLPIYVTENGVTLHDYPDPTGEVRDHDRIAYYRGYIDAVGRAIADGVDVRGYFAWSFLDNFEWAEGFDKRFGLVFTDYRTQERIPKASAYWYSDLIAARKNANP